MPVSEKAYERLKQKQELRKKHGRTRPVTRAKKLYNSRTEKRLRELEEKILQKS